MANQARKRRPDAVREGGEEARGRIETNAGAVLDDQVSFGLRSRNWRLCQ